MMKMERTISTQSTEKSNILRILLVSDIHLAFENVDKLL